MQSILCRYAALSTMGVVDVLVIPIHFAAAIPTTPLHYVNVISNDPCTKPLSSSHLILRKGRGPTPPGRRHCHKKKGIEGHGCSRHACPENLPCGQCHPQHPSMHMGNGPRCRNLPYLPTCFSRPCIEPLCPGYDHSMLCTDHPLPCLVDPMIPSPRTTHRPPYNDDPILYLPYPYALAGFVELLLLEPIPP
jgi:hypothetical protein